MSSSCRLALILLVWFAPAPGSAHAVIVPVPRVEPSWWHRQQELNQRVAEAGVHAEMIFVGDSITQRWETDGKEIWARYYAHRNAVNLGISGDRTQHVLWRLDHGNLEGIEPKVAVVMIGTNNVTSAPACVAEVAAGVTAVVSKLREHLPQTRIVLVAIVPRGEHPSALRGNVLQINQIIRKLADEQNVFWVDFGYRLVRDDGTIPPELMRDHLHLTALGYQFWAEALEEKLPGLLGDAPVCAAGAGL